MVGLVLVSHSGKLAEAVATLAKGVSAGELPIAHAGGTGPNYEELGTDATEIMEAVQQVNSGDGVVVLMDLGSAVISARMAAEMLEDEVPGIRLCPAPLVEGAVAAAVQMAAGADAETVYQEAAGALAAKTREMADGAEEPLAAEQEQKKPEAIPANALRYSFTIDDPNGMHARPAAKLATALGSFKTTEARIRNGNTGSPFVNARSLNQIALSNIRGGDVSELALWGPDAAEALGAIKKLVTDDLGGSEATAQTLAKIETDELRTLSGGMAEGTLFLYGSAGTIPAETVSDPEAEVHRFDAAIAAAQRSMEEKKGRFGASGGNYNAILEAQLLILNDAEVLDGVREAIRRSRQDAASLYQERMQTLSDSYRKITNNPYLQERAADVDGVAALVQRQLSGAGETDTSTMDDVVICGDAITTVQIGEWERARLKGILTREGGATSHIAILAKELGIPALTGYVPPSGLTGGERVLLDADACAVDINPTPEAVETFRNKLKEWVEAKQRDIADGQGKATSRDGVEVAVLANVGSLASAEDAAEKGADGIGLLRTEFLFLNRATPPDEKEQTAAMEPMLRCFAGKSVTVRTLDAGGDKPIPWLGLAPEANPFLGVRGIRVSQRRPEVFKVQLRAILRAGLGCDLGIMVPMVDTVEETAFFLGMIDACHAELEQEGVEHAWPIRRGIMAETPAAALQAKRLGEMVDFFSIGSNDLTQYVMCAERGARDLGALSDGMHPAVLKTVAMILEGGKSVSVCGEMAADPTAAAALLGLGIRHLSMSAGAIGRVKRMARNTSIAESRELANKAITLDSAEETRKLFQA